MIELFIGNKQSLPYGMALSELLDKKVRDLGRARKVYLNPTQHINRNTTTRIRSKAAHGSKLVRRERLMMSLLQMICHQIFLHLLLLL